MKRRILTLILCLSLLLTGCSGLLEREYRSVSRHVSHTSDTEDTSALRAETYSDLVNSVQYFVSAGETEGVVHLYHYSGDVEQDLSAAAEEVLTQDPLGNWALEDITFSWSRIVSYYECVFTFQYRRSAEELQGLKTVVGTSTIRQAISDTLRNYDSTLLLETNSYYAVKELLLSLVQEAYYASPGTAMGYPGVTIRVYPEDTSAPWHIVEFSFTYPESQLVLQQQAQQVISEAAALAGTLNGGTDGGVSCWLLYSRLAQRLNYAGDGAASVYAALTGQAADSQGAALAYQFLCARSGIECLTVQGTLDGAPHWWNLVQADGLWRHTDVTAGHTAEEFLRPDSAMPEGYIWNRNSYPACPNSADSSAEVEPAT